MAEKYQLKSAEQYRAFLIENKLIKDLGHGDFEFLFNTANQKWWSLRNDGNETDLNKTLMGRLREDALERLVARVKQGSVSTNEDETSPIWYINSYILTP